MMERRSEIEKQKERIKARMSKIKHKLVILSGKGGVGKSTVTANLSVTFALRGQKVGILDADIHGPSIPKIFGIRGRKLGRNDESSGIIPPAGEFGVKVVSMDFLLKGDEIPVIWRGPMKASAIRQFLSDIEWGELDLLLVDLPPGTGDESLSVMQLIRDIDGVLMITAPSQISQLVVKRAVGFTRKLKVPLVGVIENMSGFVCPRCGEKSDILGSGGGQKISEQLDIPFLGKIQIDQRISKDSDDGVPFVFGHSETPAAKVFVQVADKVEKYLERRER